MVTIWTDKTTEHHLQTSAIDMVNHIANIDIVADMINHFLRWQVYMDFLVVMAG